LENGSISFTIYGHPPAAVEVPNIDGGAQFRRKMTLKRGGELNDSLEQVLATDGNSLERTNGSN